MSNCSRCGVILTQFEIKHFSPVCQSCDSETFLRDE